MNNIKKGMAGENLAEYYLKDNSYSILCRNYRSGKSEIDIIAMQDNVLVFVEVKARTDDTYGNALCAIHTKKQQMIIKGATAFCHENDLFDTHMRFDAIEVDLCSMSVVRHIENAFFA